MNGVAASGRGRVLPGLSNRAAIYLLVLAGGLIIPMLLSTLYAYRVQEATRERAFHVETEHILSVLSAGMRDPVWTLIPDAGRPLIEAMSRGELVATIRITSVAQDEFLSHEKPLASGAKLIRKERVIIRDGEVIGTVSVDFVADGGSYANGDTWPRIVMALIIQLVFSALLILVFMRLLADRERALTRSEMLEVVGASEERFRDMAGNLPGVVYQFVIDADGKYSFPYVSPTVKQFLGLDRNQIERDANIWVERIHPDDLEDFKTSITVSHQTLAPWRFEGRMMRTDGEVFWFRGSSTPRRQEDGSTLWNGLLMDISELRAAHQKLTEAHNNLEILVEQRTRELVDANGEIERARNHLRTLVENATVGIVTTDREGRFTDVNGAFCDLFGYDRGTLLDKSLADILHADFLDQGRANLEKLLGGESGIMGIEQLFQRGDGQIFWGEISTGPIRDADGNVVGTIATLLDVSQRRAFEQALRESEKRFKDFTETASDWVWESDQDHRITFISGSVFRKIPMGPEFFLGRSRLEFVPPADITSNQELWNRHLEDLASRRAFQDFQYSMTRPNGEARHLRISGLPVFNGAGEFIGYRGTGTDVTDQVNREERLLQLSAAIESMQQPVVVLDSEDRFIFLNKAFRDLNEGWVEDITVGVTRFEHHLRDLIATGKFVPNSMSRDEWIADRVERHRNPKGPFELQRQDGTWLLINEERLPAGGLVMVFLDITQIKQAQWDLTKAKDSAERANRAKSEFLSSMSHELRTPLNSILGFAQLMEMDVEAPASDQGNRDPIQYILRSGRHLLTLVDDILDLARIESGKMNISVEETNPDEIVAACFRIAEGLASENKTVLSSGQYFNGTLPNIRTDATRTRQVLLNLMTNAIKYAGPGARVDVKGELRDNGFLRFSVTDNGPGIPEDLQAEVFAPFSRLGQEESDIDGTGIGLTISKALIETLHGHIGFHSQHGQGTVFWFELPVARETNRNNHDVNADEALDPDATPFSGTIRILYVEDNTLNTRLMEGILGRHGGASLMTARTAEEGLVVAEQDPPDVIFMDINLPGMNGFDALKQIKKRPRLQDIPVVAFTADAMKESVERGREAGFYAYITKPIRIADVMGVLSRLSQDLDEAGHDHPPIVEVSQG